MKASKKKFSRILLIVFVVLLVLFNPFLIFQLVKKNRIYRKNLFSTISLKEELEKEVKNYEKELADIKSCSGKKIPPFWPVKKNK
jgi:hypothetical protein